MKLSVQYNDDVEYDNVYEYHKYNDVDAVKVDGRITNYNYKYYANDYYNVDVD